MIRLIFNLTVAITVTQLILGCFDDNTAGTTTTGNSGIELTGLVLDKNNDPVEGIVAKMSITGLADTTDSNGRYLIQGSLPDGMLLQQSIMEVLDTVLFLQGGQQVATINVEQWIDTLPDVQIVQRNISGTLNDDGSEIGVIEAVLLGDNIPSSNPIKSDMFYFAGTNTFSGFLYFPNNEGPVNYQIFIIVFDTAGVFIGQSDTIDFTNIAGDIVIPAFNSQNAKPTANAGNDTTVNINDSIFLHGKGEDAFDGTIEKLEWKIEGGGFVEASSGDTSFTAPAVVDTQFLCILRVTDNDGNIGIDSVSIKILDEPPSVPYVNLTEVSLTLSDTTSVEIGVQISWSIETIDSSNYTSFTLFSKFQPEGDTTLVRKSIPSSQRSIKIKLPDTSTQQIYYGIQGEFLDNTGHEWKSDSIIFERIKLHSPIIINSPVEGIIDSSVLSIFNIQTTEDLGVSFKFFAFTQEFGEAQIVTQNYPFGTSDDKVFFRGRPVIDTIQFIFGAIGETVRVTWCILSTVSPGNNPLDLNQTMSCSFFFRKRPQ